MLKIIVYLIPINIGDQSIYQFAIIIINYKGLTSTTYYNN